MSTPVTDDPTIPPNPRPPISATPGRRPADGDKPTLERRFVTRMSRDLGDAVAAAARRDGLTAGAWVRRLLLDRFDLRSEIDARSGRPAYLPAEEVAAISAAVRELASVNAAITLKDPPAAKAGLERARHLLIPILIRQRGR